MLVKKFPINVFKFKGTIIQSTDIVIMLQFLGPKVESNISPNEKPLLTVLSSQNFLPIILLTEIVIMLQFQCPEIAEIL